MNSRWAPHVSAHSLASLAEHPRVYKDGVPQPLTRPQGNPYVGAPMIPYFPVVPSAQPNPSVPMPPLSPAVSQDQLEQAAVQNALAFEHSAMLHTIGGESEFGQAAAEWAKASEAAKKIAAAAMAANRPVTSQNASIRVQAYLQRAGCNQAVASGQIPHPIVSGMPCGDGQPITNPNYGWAWPEIYQQPDPTSAPAPGPGPMTPQPNGPMPGPQPDGTSYDLPPLAPSEGVKIPVPLFVALLGVVGYAGYLLIKAAR